MQVVTLVVVELVVLLLHSSLQRVLVLVAVSVLVLYAVVVVVRHRQCVVEFETITTLGTRTPLQSPVQGRLVPQDRYQERRQDRKEKD